MRAWTAVARFLSKRMPRARPTAPHCCAWRSTFQMTSYRKIIYQAENGVVRITLNRPDKRNALDAEMISELKDAIRASAEDASIRVVLLTGAGQDFCSGADLAGLQRTAESGVLENM